MKKVFVFATAIALVCGLTLNAQTPKKEAKKEAKTEVKAEPKAEAKEVKKVEVKKAKS